MANGDVAAELGQRVADAVRAAFSLRITAAQALIRPCSPGRDADYQSNVAMGLARTLGMPSRQVAAGILERFDAGEVVEPPRFDGPGFLNFVLRRDWLERGTAALAADDRLGVPLAATRRRVVVDYSGPNAAKEMHVGHLRSTIIGDAIVRLLEFRGHEVIRRNHVGDWGTPFGMLLEHLAEAGPQPGGHVISDLNRFYRRARARFDADPAFAGRARARVVALQGGDGPTLRLWRELVAESERHAAGVYRALGVRLNAADSYGESFYQPLLAGVAAELEAAGLARLSDGALCAFPPGFTGRDGRPLPLIIRKSDCGYGYGATDLAALRHWTRERKAEDLIYVTGAPQRLHLQMVFAVAEQAGWLDQDTRAVHVPFGSVLGPDGATLRTRAGEPVPLAELLSEAVERAAGVIADRGELDPAERDRIARAVGVGALKYADLSSDREKDYVFAWDRMLTLDGNTAVYVQYANARAVSVLRRAAGPDLTGPDLTGPAGDGPAPIILAHPAERALALALVRFAAAVDAAATQLRPHRLCAYLYETAQTFTAFYQACPVRTAGAAELTASRLALCRLTSRVLVRGLNLLGIEAPGRL